MELAGYRIEFKHPKTIDRPDIADRRVRIIISKSTLSISHLNMSIYAWYELDRLSMTDTIVHELLLTAVYDFSVSVQTISGSVTFFSPYMDYNRILYSKESLQITSDLLYRL